MIALSLDALLQIVAHLESTYPSEGCGLVLEGSPAGQQVVPMRNAYDRYHQKDPERFPRTSATAYLFDPLEWLRVSEQADRDARQVAVVFHSHCDVGAYFSAEDQAMAAPEGEPLLPGVAYLVVAVDGRKASGAKLFRFEEKEFREHPIALPVSPTLDPG